MQIPWPGSHILFVPQMVPADAQVWIQTLSLVRNTQPAGH
jgi:hypothetical protein